MEDNRPIRIASFLTVPQAELARIHLARHGIPARLGNAAFLSWFWHLSNAVGGATLHVSACHTERALDVLDTGARDDELSSTRRCGQCGERLDGTWETCWRCGTAADGAEEPAADPHDPNGKRPEPSGDAWVIGVISLVVGVLFLLTRGSWLVVLAWLASFPVFFLLRGLHLDAQTPRSPDDVIPPEAEPATDAAGQSWARRRGMGEAIALRAWRASLFGVCMFPPLILYAVYLLTRLNTTKTPLGRVGLCRYGTAWAVCVYGILLFGGLLLAMVYKGPRTVLIYEMMRP